MSLPNADPDSDVPDYFSRAHPQDSLSRLKARLLVAGFRLVGWFLRKIVRFRKSFWWPWPKVLIVTGFDLVQEVFARSKDFPTANDSKATAVDWQPPYLLALPQDDQNYKDMRRYTRQIFADPVLLAKLPRIASAAFSQLLPDPDAGSQWREVDLAWGYMYPGFLSIVEDYYGVTISDADAVKLVSALLMVSGFFFGSPKPTSNQNQLQDIKAAFDDAWALIEVRIQDAIDHPGTTKGALEIAVNHPDNIPVKTLTSCFLGMIMGFIPTNGSGHGRISEAMFSDPTAKAWAKHYVSQWPDPDPVKDGEFLAVLHECLRMNYILPGLFRKAEGLNLVIGSQSKRPQYVEPGSTILASTMAAMFDPDHMDKPFEFRPDRSYWGYLNYGYKMHFCVGWDISNIIMIEYYRALIIRNFELKPGGKQVLRSMFPWRIDVRYQKPV